LTLKDDYEEFLEGCTKEKAKAPPGNATTTTTTTPKPRNHEARKQGMEAEANGPT